MVYFVAFIRNPLIDTSDPEMSEVPIPKLLTTGPRTSLPFQVASLRTNLKMLRANSNGKCCKRDYVDLRKIIHARQVL